MELHAVHTGNFKLDGGAMFGVVPYSLWSKVNPPDENNLCSWAMRCLLIKDGDRAILVDNGIGNKQGEKFFSHYYLHGGHSLDSSLKALGIHRDQITDVFLTHLHFDHCGGSIVRDGSGKLVPAFKNATYWSNQEHWAWATHPNAREKASFLKENILPIEESGQLKFIKDSRDLHPDIEIITVNGHTQGQMLPVIPYRGKKVVFCADLLPSAGHLPVAWVMAYDTQPLLTLKEKAAFLDRALREDWILMFEHDRSVECATLMSTEKGARVKETLNLGDF